MNRKYYFFFKVLAFFLVGFPLSVVSPKLGFSDQPLIIDHTCTDISQIPESAIEQAKINLHIAYGHTSHGSQLTTGMSGLVGFANNGGLGLSLPTDIFAWNNGGTGGALDLHDGAMGGDCGYYPQWVNNTRNYLGDPDPLTGRGTTNPDVNVIVWSWCGQVDDKYAAGTLDSEYLTPMSQLETDYPGVTFIYMTGHVDHWDDSNNKAANQMVRDYCIGNNKVLYDFADIESYDPDGIFYEFPHDNCDYYESVSGSKLGNWAIEWQNSHTEDVDWYVCTSAHSQPLNANRKAYAAWWLWARLAGWNPDGGPITNFSGIPTTGTAPLEVSFSDSSTGEVDSWAWSFGDGGSSSEQNPTYTYDDPGTYTVILQVTGPGGSDTETKNGYITVSAPSVQYSLTVNIVGQGSVTLNPPGGTYDAGTVVQLTAVPGGGRGTEGMFTGWSGGMSGSDNPDTITMDSHKTVTATFIEIGVESGDLTSMSCVDPSSIEDSPDKPDDFPYGLIEMEIEVINAGDQAIVTIYLSKVAPADYKWYKYTSTGEWIDFDRDVISGGSGDGAVFNVDRTEVTLYITDNGQYDDDPTVMIIRDPSGLGFLTASSSSAPGSSGGSGGGCFISSSAPGLAMIDLESSKHGVRVSEMNGREKYFLTSHRDTKGTDKK